MILIKKVLIALLGAAVLLPTAAILYDYVQSSGRTYLWRLLVESIDIIFIGMAVVVISLFLPIRLRSLGLVVGFTIISFTELSAIYEAYGSF